MPSRKADRRERQRDKKRRYEREMDQFVHCQRKRAFDTREEARTFATYEGGRHKPVTYRCRYCKKFHNGHDGNAKLLTKNGNLQ